MVVATAAAAAGAVVVVAATVVVAVRRKRRRRSMPMAEGVELDSKLSANSSVLQHLGDGDASGAQDDDDGGGGDPEVIISNPGRGGDVAGATALEVDRKGKRKLSPEEAAILTRLTRLIDDDDVD